MNTSKRILLVDDDYDIADMLKLFLEEHGYALWHAADGAEALAHCQQFMPHLILMDIILPDMDGYEVYQRLGAHPRTAHIPIIFLTRRADREARLQALELGADDFIAKPFDMQELLLRVRNSMKRAEHDERSGLPGASVTRRYLAEARTDPALAIIEVVLVHSTPYRTRYGEAALRDVQDYLGQLVVWSLSQSNAAEGFVGHLETDQFALICPAPDAQAIAERIVSIFDFQTGRYYDDEDRQRGHLLIGARRQPFMRAICRVYHGERYFEIPWQGDPHRPEADLDPSSTAWYTPQDNDQAPIV